VRSRAVRCAVSVRRFAAARTDGRALQERRTTLLFDAVSQVPRARRSNPTRREQGADRAEPESRISALAAALGASLGAGARHHPERHADAAVLDWPAGVGCAWPDLA